MTGCYPEPGADEYEAALNAEGEAMAAIDAELAAENQDIASSFTCACGKHQPKPLTEEEHIEMMEIVKHQDIDITVEQRDKRKTLEKILHITVEQRDKRKTVATLLRGFWLKQETLLRFTEPQIKECIGESVDTILAWHNSQLLDELERIGEAYKSEPEQSKAREALSMSLWNRIRELKEVNNG
jgi:translation initiation factor 1 (eIF-1/SUI1)